MNIVFNGKSVKIIDDVFELSCNKIKDYTYAFYVESSAGIEKQLYTDRRHYLSKTKAIKGYFTFTFFIKSPKGDKEFFKIHAIYDGNESFKKVSVSNIFESENNKIDYYDVDSPITFIVFNATTSTKSSKPFGLSYLLQKNINVIGCLQAPNTQYQGLSFELFKKNVEYIVKNKKVFLYGSSLGGYCAVYYAGAVNGTVIAAAPRNSLHPEMIKSGHSLNSPLSFQHEDIALNARTENKVYIFVDPLIKEDVFYLNSFILPFYKNARVIECKHTGHPVFYHLNKTRQLDKIITAIIEGKDEFVLVNQSLTSEFTDYEKAKYYYSLSREYVNKCLSRDGINPLIKKRAESFKKNFK